MSTSTTTERQAKFPESWFYIKNQASSLVLDVEGGSIKVGDNVVTATLKKKDYESQLWKFNEGTLINKKSNLVLDVKMGNLKPSTEIIQWSAKGAEENINQRFGLTPEGHIYVVSKPTLVLGFKEGIFGRREGAHVNLQLQDKKDKKEQRWDFVVPVFKKSEKETDAVSVKSQTPETAANTEGTFPDDFFFIKSQQSGFLLGVEGGSTVASDKLTVDAMRPKDHNSQLWQFRNGTLINKKSGLALDLEKGSTASGSQTCQNTIAEGPSQEWGLTIEGYIYTKGNKHLVLGIKESWFSSHEGAHVYLLDKKDVEHKEQRWNFVVPVFKITATVFGVFPKGHFFIKNTESDLLLTIESHAHGAKIILRKLDYKAYKYQLWSYRNGYLINYKTKYVLDIEGSSLTIGTELIQCEMSVHKAINQHWGLSVEGYIFTKSADYLVIGTADQTSAKTENTRVRLITKPEGEVKHVRWAFLSTTTTSGKGDGIFDEVVEAIAVVGGIAVGTQVIKEIVDKGKKPSEPSAPTTPSSPDEAILLTTPLVAAAEEEDLPDGFWSITRYKNVRDTDEFPKGWFFIKSALHGFVFDVQDSSTNAGAQVVVTRLRSKDYASQLWAYHNGYIINLKSRLVIDVRADDKESYWPLIQNPAKTGGRVSQRWGVNPEEYIFSFAQKSMCLTLKDLVLGGKPSLEIFLTEAKQSKEHREQRTECRWIFLVPVFAKGKGKKKPSTYIPSTTFTAGATAIAVVGSELIEGSTSGKQKEMARMALETPLIQQDLIQLESIKSQYLQRYKIAELDAIRRRHHSVSITSGILNDITTQMSASGASVTSLIHNNITLKGPLKDIPIARDAVELLLSSIDVQQVDVVYPVTQEVLALHRFKSLAGSIETRKNVIVEYFRKGATRNNVTINIVAIGGIGEVRETLEEFAAVRFCSKTTYKIPDDQYCPVEEQLNIFKTSILNDFNVSVNFRRDRVVELIGETDKMIASAKSHIETLMEGESASRSYTIPDVRYRLWFEKWKDVDEIVMIAKQHNVWIKPERNGDCLSYKISGARNNIVKAFASFKTYADKVTSELQSFPVRVDRQRAEIILTQRDEVKKIEQNHRVEILLPKTDFGVVIGATNQAIELVCGDIVHEAVDAIVNSASARLDHGGGIAKVIANAAGQQLRDECKNYIAQYGSMSTGNALVTTAGDLQKKGVKYVIHVIGPVWSSGMNKEEEHLHAAVTNALLLANAKGCETVALPPIGTGLSGFPHEKGAKIIVDAVLRILPKTQIHKVRIIDFKPEQVVKGTPAKDRDDVDVKDANQQNRTEVYPILREVLSERWKEIENEIATGSGDSSVLARPTLQPLPYQWFWMEDFGGKQWIMYGRDENIDIENAYNRWRAPVSVTAAIPVVASVKIVSGVKSGVSYEILFGERNHFQRNTRTNHKRPIMRNDIIIPITAKADLLNPQVTSNNGKNPTPLDYKYWKELVEFVITGTCVDTAAATKELESLVNIKTEFIPMMGPWQKIGPAERDAAVRMIAGRLYVDVEFNTRENRIKLTGHEGFVDTVLTEVYKWAYDKSANIENDVPKDWDKFDEKVNCVLVALSATSKEWKTVVASVNQTMPHARIQKIERIQNRHLWFTYQHNHRQLSKKNEGQVNVLSLFHGTRSTLPSDIYESEEGFDPRFSARGMWGKGCYFAVNASYSNDYAFVSGSKQFFLADVITGDSITLPPDNSITFPPTKARQCGKFKNERYDSINGNTEGSTIYIVYSPGRFYPTYLITYM